jgi:hypothetical protein
MARDIAQRASDAEEDEVVSAADRVGPQPMVVHPRLGTGWETTINDSTRVVCLQFKFLGLALPVRKRIPFSDVVHLAVVLTYSWWSRGRGLLVYPWNMASSGPGTRLDRTPPSTAGWRYDLLMTQKGGRTIKIETLKSSHAADDLTGQLRRRLGLPSVN